MFIRQRVAADKYNII